MQHPYDLRWNPNGDKNEEEKKTAKYFINVFMFITCWSNNVLAVLERDTARVWFVEYWKWKICMIKMECFFYRKSKEK